MKSMKPLKNHDKDIFIKILLEITDQKYLSKLILGFPQQPMKTSMHFYMKWLYYKIFSPINVSNVYRGSQYLFFYEHWDDQNAWPLSKNILLSFCTLLTYPGLCTFYHMFGIALTYTNVNPCVSTEMPAVQPRRLSMDSQAESPVHSSQGL